MARNYAKEYAASRTPKRRKANIMRQRARRLMIKKKGKAALKGMEVDHRNMDPTNNSPGNLQLLTISANRKKQPKRK